MWFWLKRTWLKKRLESPDPAVRAKAAAGLGKMERRAALDGLSVLLEHFADPDDSVRVEAVRAAGTVQIHLAVDFVASTPLARAEVRSLFSTILAKSVPDLVALDGSGNPEARVDAVRLLGWAGERGACGVATLVQCLREDDGRLRLSAIRSLGQIGPAAREGVPALVDYLQDVRNKGKCGDEHIAAARALGEIGDPLAAPVLLLCCLRCWNYQMIEAAAEALPLMGPEFEPAWMTLLGTLGPAMDVRTRVPLAIASPDDLVDRFILSNPIEHPEGKHDDSPEAKRERIFGAITARRHACASVFHIRKSLTERLDSTDETLLARLRPAAEVVHRTSKQAVKALAHAMKRAMNRDLEREVLSALRVFGQQAAPVLPEVVSVLGSSNLTRRAADVLGAIGDEAIPALRDCLTDRGRSVDARVGAIWALTAIGPSAAGVLTDCICDPDARDTGRAHKEYVLVQWCTVGLAQMGQEGLSGIRRGMSSSSWARDIMREALEKLTEPRQE